MAKRFWKSICAGLAALLICFAGSGFAQPRLPRGCAVEGIDVSGKTLGEAAAAVNAQLARELSQKSLTVRAGDRTYVFRAPDLYYSTDLRSVLLSASKGKGKEHTLQKRLCLAGEERAVRGICADLFVRSQNARTVFDPHAEEPVRFLPEVCGRCVNGARLREQIRAALEGGGGEVEAEVDRVCPPVTLREAKENAVLLSRFTTYFNRESANRAHNIALAANSVCGTVGAGEEFSFNAAAGERSQKNGYLPAPVILSGEFTEGVGGGVCQVSTTIYNAALLAGMRITEYHPHSLAVGYVPPSFDAMVSGSGCDLRFRNETGGRIYLVCRVSGGALTAEIYGRFSGTVYERESVVTGSIPPPEPERREVAGASEEREIRAPKAGVKSEGYLLIHTGGKTYRRRLRRDSYAPVRGIIECPVLPENTANPQNG